MKQVKVFLTLTLIIAFISTSLYMPQAHAGDLLAGKAGVVVPILPKPGTMVNISSAFVPAHLQGIVIHPDNALQFDFLIHKGDGHLSEEQKREEYNKLIKYFLASLTVADKDQWVNLSPYESNRIIQDDFGKTEMGRDLLAQDYLLKQITSSLMYPESGLGKEFWNRIYEKVNKELGNVSIPVNTFNKVWIVPSEAEVHENGNTAFIVKSHLKVMLEEDYLAVSKNQRQPGDISPTEMCPQAGCQANNGVNVKARQGNNQLPSITSQAIRQIILPALEKEVNEGKNFAQLRQVFSGMILATWYKQALKESLLGKVYADKAKVNGITQQDPKTNEAIYQQYLQAFKKGVYNYIKEEKDQLTNQPIPRKYFAGGAQGLPEGLLKRAMVGDKAMHNNLRTLERNLDAVMANLNPRNAEDKSHIFNQAMTSDELINSHLVRVVAENHVYEFKGPDQKTFFVKVAEQETMRREMFGYEVADFIGMNTPSVQIINEKMLRLLKIDFKGLTPKNAIITSSIDEMQVGDLRQSETSGLEEVAIFNQLLAIGDVNTRGFGLLNIKTMQIAGMKRYIEYDPEYQLYASERESKMEAEIIDGWKGAIADFDVIRFMALFQDIKNRRNEFVKILDLNALEITQVKRAILINRFDHLEEIFIGALEFQKTYKSTKDNPELSSIVSKLIVELNKSRQLKNSNPAMAAFEAKLRNSSVGFSETNVESGSFNFLGKNKAVIQEKARFPSAYLKELTISLNPFSFDSPEKYKLQLKHETPTSDFVIVDLQSKHSIVLKEGEAITLGRNLENRHGFLGLSGPRISSSHLTILVENNHVTITDGGTVGSSTGTSFTWSKFAGFTKILTGSSNVTDDTHATINLKDIVDTQSILVINESKQSFDEIEYSKNLNRIQMIGSKEFIYPGEERVMGDSIRLKFTVIEGVPYVSIRRVNGNDKIEVRYTPKPDNMVITRLIKNSDPDAIRKEIVQHIIRFAMLNQLTAAEMGTNIFQSNIDKSTHDWVYDLRNELKVKYPELRLPSFRYSMEQLLTEALMWYSRLEESVVPSDSPVLAADLDLDLNVTTDPAMAPGGIDMNAGNMALVIKRDGKGLPLPLTQQNMAQLAQIDGFVPHIIEIRPLVTIPMYKNIGVY